MMVDTEADTCRKFVVPLLQQAGWDGPPHEINEQRTFTDGRIVFVGGKARRGKRKRADYLLRYRPDFPIAVVEAKARYKNAAEGLQQARDYAEVLGLKFAYATNGATIIEVDYLTGKEGTVDAFPRPDELWRRQRLAEGPADDAAAAKLLTPGRVDPSMPLRYYQEIAVNRAVQEVITGRKRILLTLCTGSGKTAIAFQVAWKLWTSRWNAKSTTRQPKMLFLADRNFLVDDPMAKDFSPFGDARHKIAGGDASKSRDMYFATYQSIAGDERRPGLFREYPRDFFDLVIVDECHRGSARADGNWREILEWFEPATQLGMTATPRREDNVDTYEYFGDPIYEYSLARGIDDGFLAPFRVHRVITDYDAVGWRPSKGELDRHGRAIPDGEYHTPDFERLVALKARTRAIAKHLAEFMRQTDRHAKTIVFCVDQEHALEMRGALVELNTDLVRKQPDYVCRVTADEGEVGAAHRAKFQDVETRSPVILTTSQLLTTGLNAPTCKNVVLARVVGSMPEFKQIIGRGTRLRPDYGKLAFNIVDYTGTATEKFADPEFDGPPMHEDHESIGEVEDEEHGRQFPYVDSDDHERPPENEMDENHFVHRKYYVDGGAVEIVRHLVYELDSDGKQIACRQLTDYTAEKVRTLYPSASDLRRDWLSPERREEIVERLLELGVDIETLGESLDKPEADPFDLLCHLAFNAPLRTRRERAARVKGEEAEFFERYGPAAREVLEAMLDKYSEYGSVQFKLPDILQIPPISGWGNVIEIADRFGGAASMREAVAEMQRRLYAA